MSKKHIVPHTFGIKRSERNKANGHRSVVVFFTGLSGSGKSTLANALEENLFLKGIKTYTLDGDNVRAGLNNNLGFSPADRTENIRRIGELSKLFIDAGLVVLAAFVAPFEQDRNFIRNCVGADAYIEIFVNTSLEVCEARDVKGLYAKARRGEISEMTGISSPYEIPQNPDLVISTELSVPESIAQILAFIEPKIRIKS
ncbi:MAG: hypothetical protein RLZZ241_907 [Bacteroidota bacterium]|jgi:adenylylsulfate kinase